MNEVRVRVAGSSFGKGDTTYSHDDEFTVRESVADRHPNTLEVVGSGDGHGDDGDTTTESDGGAGDSEEEPSQEDLNELPYSDLRHLATESGHPDINGRSSREAIIEALSDEQ